MSEHQTRLEQSAERIASNPEIQAMAHEIEQLREKYYAAVTKQLQGDVPIASTLTPEVRPPTQAPAITSRFWAAFLAKESKDLRQLVEDVRCATEGWEITNAALLGYVTEWTVARGRFELMMARFLVGR